MLPSVYKERSEAYLPDCRMFFSKVQLPGARAIIRFEDEFLPIYVEYPLPELGHYTCLSGPAILALNLYNEVLKVWAESISQRQRRIRLLELNVILLKERSLTPG